MKKKMISFGALVMAVVITASSVGGTYAKYTDTASNAATGKVAKWDVTAGTVNVADLFAASTNGTGNKQTADRLAPSGYGEVELTTGAANDNSGATSTTEVEYTLSSSFNIVSNTVKLELTSDEADKANKNYVTADEITALGDLVENDGTTNYYSPIKFYLYSYTPVDGDDAATKAARDNARASKTVVTLENLQTELDNMTLSSTAPIVIGWMWADTAPAGSNQALINLVNRLDTELGKLGGESSTKTLEVAASVTATQVTK